MFALRSKDHPVLGRPTGRCRKVGAVVLSFAALVLVFAEQVQAQRQDTASSANHAKGHAKELSAAFRAAAHQVLPAVVSVRQVARPEIRAEPRSEEQLPEDNPFEGTPFEDFFEDYFREFGGRGLRPEIPRGPMGMGSGFVIDSAGVIVTNNHVVEGADELRVRLGDERELKVTKVKTDPRTDLAVLWVEGEGELATARFGNSDEMDIGDWVLAVGHPFGLFESVTAGIISAKGRGIGVALREDFLQTDAAINPGNSGGPLINLDGDVIGINTAISSRTGGYQGAGFAIPSNLARWVVEQLIEKGEVKRSYLGTQIGPVTAELAEQFKVPVGGGALIADVFDDSPAAEAGIKAGDVIVEFGNRPIKEPRELQAAVEVAPIGSSQPVVIVRDGEQMKLEVKLREQPKDYGVRVGRRSLDPSGGERTEYEELGLEVGPLTEAIASRLNLDNTEGVAITGVAPGSAADLAGLAPGMAVTEVNQKPVRSVEEFGAAVRKDSPERQGILLRVRTPEGFRFVVIQVGQ
jgi:serine protease Do